MGKKHWGAVGEVLGVTLGSFITALGLVAFLIPNKIAAGGVSGLATLLFYLFGFPVGITMLIINAPLLILCIKELGMHFGLKSLYGTFMLSFFVDFLASYITKPWTADPLLAAIYGGVVTGTGIGVVFRSKGTTGGTDLAAALINRFFRFSLGYSLLAIDGLVIVLAGIVFDLEMALYALVAVFVTGKMIDLVQEGVSYARAAVIISECYEEISRELMHRMNRGVTAFPSRGVYTSSNREVLLCVVTQSEVSVMKSIIYNVDPRAFVIVTNVNEVLGEGFKKVEDLYLE